MVTVQSYLCLWFLEENECILWKTWTLWTSISFQDTVFQVEYSVWKLLLWLVHMQFPIQNQYIHTSRESKQQKQLWNRTFHLKSRGISKNLSPYHNVKTQSECYETLDITKSLLWKDFSKPVSYWNLNISYGHIFSTESNLGIMYWNLNPHKMLETNTLEKGTKLSNKF